MSTIMSTVMSAKRSPGKSSCNNPNPKCSISGAKKQKFTGCNIFSKPKMERKTRRSNSAAAQNAEILADYTKITCQSRRESKKFQSFFSCSEKAPDGKGGECIDVPTVSSAHGTFDESDIEEEEYILPLSGPGLQWYKERGIHVASNMVRNEQRMKGPVIMEGNQSKGLFRGSTTGTLNVNIEALMQRLTEAGSLKFNFNV